MASRTPAATPLAVHRRGPSRRGRRSISLFVWACCCLSGCSALQTVLGLDGADPLTPYGAVLARARSGDGEEQNLLGMMLFFGEGAPRSRAAAHRWFHAAADRGHAPAQMNLAVMHYLGAGVPRDLEEAQRYFDLARASAQVPAVAGGLLAGRASIEEVVEAARTRVASTRLPGEETYTTFCAGCHGLNGIAAYVRAPSFAAGQRLDKSDAELLRTVRTGHGDMPGWDHKLPPRALEDAIAFIRSLPAQYELGVLQSLRPAPRLFFLFGPMRTNPSAYHGLDEDDVERLLRTRPR